MNIYESKPPRECGERTNTFGIWIIEGGNGRKQKEAERRGFITAAANESLTFHSFADAAEKSILNRVPAARR
jgi:hypothetical protein